MSKKIAIDYDGQANPCAAISVNGKCNSIIVRQIRHVSTQLPEVMS